MEDEKDVFSDDMLMYLGIRTTLLLLDAKLKSLDDKISSLESELREKDDIIKKLTDSIDKNLFSD